MIGDGQLFWDGRILWRFHRPDKPWYYHSATLDLSPGERQLWDILSKSTPDPRFGRWSAYGHDFYVIYKRGLLLLLTVNTNHTLFHCLWMLLVWVHLRGAFEIPIVVGALDRLILNSIISKMKVQIKITMLEKAEGGFIRCTIKNCKPRYHNVI